ncbi:hypothetical protein TNCV_1297511 [Trichonephila clavipes]|nr:hypothetical protein TNCV_1297511 [Trichonephila clavipes]
MRALEDAGKNEWKMVDFIDRILVVDLGPQQIGRTDLMSDQLSQHLIHRYQPSDVRPAHECPPSTMTIHRWLIEQILCSYRPLRHLPFTPARCPAKLQRCLV